MSKLIICPGCDNIIEDTDLINNECPKCGLSYNDLNLIEELKKVYLCPKCGEIYTSCESRNNDYLCSYCNCKLIHTDYTMKQHTDFIIKENANVKDQVRIFANKYGDFQFSDTAYDRRMEIIQVKRRQREAAKNPPKPQQHCPVCNSTNIQKISVASKAVGAGLFGIFSKTARSQFECKDCGYKF